MRRGSQAQRETLASRRQEEGGCSIGNGLWWARLPSFKYRLFYLPAEWLGAHTARASVHIRICKMSAMTYHITGLLCKFNERMPVRY